MNSDKALAEYVVHITADHLLNWMNSLDSSEMTVKDFRKALHMKLLELDYRTVFKIV